MPGGKLQKDTEIPDSLGGMSSSRSMLVVVHPNRHDVQDAVKVVFSKLADDGVLAVVTGDQKYLQEFSPQPLRVLGVDHDSSDIELGIVLGGDGTILRAAEILRGYAAPLLGVNHGHVGFLAESEKTDLEDTVARALDRKYSVEERMALTVRVTTNAGVVYDGWALNEASIEKAAPQKMIEVAIGIDDEPLSTFGCDGVVVATPTGSTAYSFSAGGPIVWPGVEALLMVPLAAHALFQRPLVTGPDSVLSIVLLERSRADGMLSCDGRRSFRLEPGMRVEVSKSDTPIRLARLAPGPFTSRLVRKFSLPVEGWRKQEAAGQ